MTHKGRLSVTIIGGGASGVLLAAHLLRDPETDIRVTLLERRGQFGQGMAYSASQREHKVNVPARGMSAFADDPDHFWRWLQARDYPSTSGSWVFVPRRLYGVYLEHVLAEAGRLRPGRLVVHAEEAVSVRESVQGIETVLDNGTGIISHYAVLAVGHETQPARGRGIAVRVGSALDTPLEPEDSVIILGSGLSMVDAWLSLAQAEHQGRIVVVSRNGLLPIGHIDVPPLAHRCRRRAIRHQSAPWSPRPRPRVATGAASSTGCGPSTSASGRAGPNTPGARRSATCGHGGTSTATVCRPSCTIA